MLPATPGWPAALASGRPHDQADAAGCLLHVEHFVVELVGERCGNAKGNALALADLVARRLGVDECQAQRRAVVVPRSALDAQRRPFGDAFVGPGLADERGRIVGGLTGPTLFLSRD